MKLYKGYLYHLWYTTGTLFGLARIKTNGKNYKQIRSMNEFNGYAVSKNKIYVDYYDDENGRTKKVMTLTGKKVRKSSYKVVNKYKKSNAKNYKIVKQETPDFDDWDGTGSVVTYLQIPGGKLILISSYTGEYIQSLL